MSTFGKPYLVFIDLHAWAAAPQSVKAHVMLQGLEQLAMRLWAGFDDSADAYAYTVVCPLPSKIVDNSDGHLDALIAVARQATAHYNATYQAFMDGTNNPAARASAYNDMHEARIELEKYLP